MVSTISGYGVSGYGSGGLASMLQSVYAKADTNSDSSLSKDELIGALSKTGKSSDGSKLSSAVDELVGSLDSDSSGTLGATEFSSFASQFDYGGGSTLLAAQEAAGNQPPPGPPPANDSASSEDADSSPPGAAGSAGAAGGSSTTYDPLDTNQDGYVSAEERMAGVSGASFSQAGGVTSSRLGSDTLRFLMSSMNEVAAA
ncbi:hypothetical protein J2847_001589 [Azospirillum agricola]|uniref:EF-hand domain-containing protein n=1 Tax=Azospirillum agricola TaxID=1720247 RepID=UPI001AE57356|nr:EF-hand domain-containing protein [Azospirillum agricola]MBP2228307.1 hypothetical protein [Azospirillum agricola]